METSDGYRVCRHNGEPPIYLAWAPRLTEGKGSETRLLGAYLHRDEAQEACEMHRSQKDASDRYPE